MDIPHLHKFAGGSSYILDGAWPHFRRRFDTFWSAFALRSEGILKPRLVKLWEDEHQWIPGVKARIPRFWSHLRWRELMFIGSIFFQSFQSNTFLSYAWPNVQTHLWNVLKQKRWWWRWSGILRTLRMRPSMATQSSWRAEIAERSIQLGRCDSARHW